MGCERKIPISEVPAEQTNPWCAALFDPLTDAPVMRDDVESITCKVTDGKTTDVTYPDITGTIYDEWQEGWEEDNRGYNCKHLISFAGEGHTYLARLIVKLKSGSTVVVLRYFVTY